MIVYRALAAGLAAWLSLGAALAVDRDLTGSIDRPAAIEPAPDAAALAAAAKALAVTLPEQSVTTSVTVQRALPPLKPLPKWDPRVCIGC